MQRMENHGRARTHARKRTSFLLAAAAATAGGAAVLVAPSAAPAADRNWINGAGGTFSTTGNWLNGLVPGSGDWAHFVVTPSGTGPTYPVNFSAPATTAGMYVHNDKVTFNLAGQTYTQSG